tara:strand:- start:11131 stop:12015 length:885 start_codon:yes stop_codon:yes gene_type:complete
MSTVPGPITYGPGGFFGGNQPQNGGVTTAIGNQLTEEEQRQQAEAQAAFSSAQDPQGNNGGYNPLFNSTSFSPTEAGEGERSTDTIFRFIRDQLNASRARFNQIGSETGATEQAMRDAQNPLRDQRDLIDGQMGALDGLTDDLTSSSLGTTAGAGVAAVNAARLSGGGRSGGGGNAARVAARGATDAAVGQSAALSQALVQGKLGEANYKSGLLQQRGGINAALSQLLQSQAGLREDRARLGVANENEAAQTLVGALDVFGDVESAQLGFGDDVEIAWISALGNVASATARNQR